MLEKMNATLEDYEIDDLIEVFEAKKPSWHFLLSSGYEDHPESDGKKYFCHLMAPDFEAHQDDPEYDVAGFGSNPTEAFCEALSQMVQEDEIQ